MNPKLPHAGLQYDVLLVDPHGRVLTRDLGLNLVPIEGLAHALDVLLHGATPITTWYIAPFEADYDPVPTITAATFPAQATECTTYTSATRIEYQENAPVGGSMTGATAEFVSTADKTVYGFAMLGAPGKGSTSSKILSIVKLPSPKDFKTGSKLLVVASPFISSAS